jgi:ABC-type nickel/cobalt efflux system permease component RcnA
MKTNRYVWGALSVLICSLGVHLLVDSIRHSGPYADEYVLLGATLTVLGLATLAIRFGQHWQTRAVARHMRRGSHFSSTSRGADNS